MSKYTAITPRLLRGTYSVLLIWFGVSFGGRHACFFFYVSRGWLWGFEVNTCGGCFFLCLCVHSFVSTDCPITVHNRSNCTSLALVGVFFLSLVDTMYHVPVVVVYGFLAGCFAGWGVG